MTNGRKLPWGEIISDNDSMSNISKLLKKRLSLDLIKKYLLLLPRSLIDIGKQILALKYDQEPPYDEIIEKLRTEMKNNVQFGEDH